MEAGSSPDPVETVPESTPDVATSPDASTPAAPSPAETKGAESAPSLIDSVKEALGEAKKESSPDSAKGSDADPSAPKAEGDGKPDPAAEQEIGELTEDELKKYAPKTQKRIRQLLTQRGEFEERAKAAESKAELFGRIETFADQNGLSGEDVEGLLEIGALVRGDPFKALDRLTPIYSELLKRTGHVLPAPIQERVQQGYLTEEDARRLVQAETKAALARERQTASDEQLNADRLRSQAQVHVGNVKSAATEWEATRKSNDPDWSLKQPRVAELVELEVHRNGYPTSTADVVKMLNDIEKKVSDELKRFSPKPREVIPAKGGASSGATAEPKTALEAARIALGGRS